MGASVKSRKILKIFLKETFFQILYLFPDITLRKLFYLLEPQFLYLKNGNQHYRVLSGLNQIKYVTYLMANECYHTLKYAMIFYY